MIKIDRGSPPANNILDEEKTEMLNQIEELVEEGKPWSKKKFYLWKKDDKVKPFLFKEQHGKCCYCEWSLHNKMESDVEHFRPKAEVSEAEKHSGYWWLVYDWDNLLISCANCNRLFKKASFPLKDESKRAYKKGDNLSKEEPLLINPLKENPENFIGYNLPNEGESCFMIKAVGKCERGRKTVEFTGINAREPMEKRAKLFKRLQSLKKFFEQSFKEELVESKFYELISEEFCTSDSDFSGFTNFYLKTVFRHREVSLEKQNV